MKPIHAQDTMVMDLRLPKKTQPCYKWIVITLSLITFLLFCVTVFFHFSAIQNATENGMFKNGIDTVSDKFALDITPADYTFIIQLAIIYIWQAAWIIYVLTSLCRRNQYGAVFTNPPIVTPFFLMSFCLHLWLNIMWLFLFDSKLIVWSFICSFLMYFTLEFPVLMSHHVAVHKYGKQLKKDHKVDRFAIRILIQNGLALYRTWIVFATILNFCTVLTYEGNVTRSTSSTVGLVIVAVFVILDFIIGTTIWDKYQRYTFSNWGVYIWVLIGILVDNWDASNRNSVITLVLLFVCIIFVAIKIPLTKWRHRNKPLYVV
ncbi:uncharacterized protein [Amphiura filiformis]|uniref:uncharacterized protein n=1 Tax=Amphiura filiformis TaxID=82378 RepID=UPI003B217E5B